MLQEVIIAATVEEAFRRVADLTMDGWAIDPAQPGEAMFFGGCVVHMYRDDATVNAFKERADEVQAKPKMTAQERMAHARSQRGKGKLDVNNVFVE